MYRAERIEFVREEDKRKIYQITELGMEVLELELKRIQNAEAFLNDLKVKLFSIYQLSG